MSTRKQWHNCTLAKRSIGPIYKTSPGCVAEASLAYLFRLASISTRNEVNLYAYQVLLQSNVTDALPLVTEKTKASFNCV